MSHYKELDYQRQERWERAIEQDLDYRYRQERYPGDIKPIHQERRIDAKIAIWEAVQSCYDCDATPDVNTIQSMLESHSFFRQYDTTDLVLRQWINECIKESEETGTMEIYPQDFDFSPRNTGYEEPEPEYEEESLEGPFPTLAECDEEIRLAINELPF